MASTYLTRTLGTSTNVYKGTVSHWIKRSGLGSMGTFAAWNNGVSDTNRAYLNLYNDTIYFYDEANSVVIQTNRLFRDTSAWYHIVVAWDTSQGTVADRIKIYVNGVQETSFATANYPSVNSTLQFNTSGRTFGLGSYANSGAAAGFFDGSISHFNFIDGQSYDASYFGETDATTGEWKIKTSPSVTYGTNGFFILKDGNSVTDQSGNSNNFTVGGGTLTKTEDNPSNVFATLNVLDSALGYTGVPINGNLTINGSANDRGLRGTLGASSGKYYWEIKMNEKGNIPGVARADAIITFDANITPGYWSIQSSGTGSDMKSYINGTPDTTNALQGYADGTIVGIALDMDNGKVYYSYDGVFKGLNNNTSDPVNQTNPTFTGIPNTFMLPWIEHRSSTANGSQFNFGNGYFGTTAVSSAGTNASGNGIFEYDVPTGYTALSTKGLNL